MPTYAFPTAARLREIEMDLLPRLIADDPLSAILPMEEVNESVIMWTQGDNYLGLQQLRGLNGEPSRVARVGARTYLAQPGVYGEFLAIDETELTRRGRQDDLTQHINLTDLVMKLQEQLLQRRLDRWRHIGWTLLATGTFSVAAPNGAVLHTDTYSMQTAAAAVSWATLATATPIIDFRALQTKHRGHSVDFGRRAKAYLNRTTANNLLNNTNAADLAGRRVDNGNTVNSLNAINSIMLDNDLPEFVIYDEGYLDDSGTFQPWIPNERVVVVGRRTNGGRLGSYQMTRNASNPNSAPGAYTRVVTKGIGENERPPASIEVHDGHNGGPAIEFPSAVIVFDTTP